MTGPVRDEPATSTPGNPVGAEPTTSVGGGAVGEESATSVQGDPVREESATSVRGEAVGEGSATSVSGEALEAGPRSGLRNPQAAVRGLGAGTLILEAIVLLLAIQPIRIMGGHLGGWGIGAVVALALVAVLLSGLMGRSWAWPAGSVLQVLLLASGLLHWSLAALGLIFGVTWAYAVHVRRKILG